MDQKFQTIVSTSILITAPRKPWRKKRIKQISAMLADIDEVREAHLPQVIEIGSTAPPEITLFIVVEPASAVATVMETIDARLAALLGRGETLKVRPISPQDELLTTVRGVDCVIGWRD